MSRNWVMSNLKIGEDLRISPNLFIGGDSTIERLESITYLGETETGIMVKYTFKPSIKSNKSPSYRMMITWASLWCGQVKIYAGDGTLVVAKRQKGQPIAYEVNFQ